MDGIHDLGGLQGFGRIPYEQDEPTFHAGWERRLFGISVTAPLAVPFGDDHFRAMMERMPPLDYLAASYYERWYWSIARLVAERGVTEDPSQGPRGGAASPAEVEQAIAAGASQARPEAAAPHRFRVGQRVRTRAVMGFGHNRLPRYARGKLGQIESAHGAFILADSNAARGEPDPQQLYTVVFAARELWGAEAPAGDSVTLDLWDAYLDPA